MINLLILISFFLPSNEIIIINRPEVKIREVTAYTLRPQETDSSPCETALGPKVNICEWAKKEQLCATRDYPLLTRLQVGDVECIVVDRPAKKYGERIDLIMPTVESALQFGIKNLRIVEK